MGVLSWIILGLIAGAVAKAILPGSANSGCIVTIIIGILGAVVGGWIGSELGWGKVDEFSIRTLLMSILGSVIILSVYALLRKKN